MTSSQRAVEAAWNAYQNTPIDLLADSDEETKRCVVNAITAYHDALAVDGVALVEIGSLSEHKLGLEWFERTFEVPLGDKPGARKANEIRAMLAAASEGDGEKSPQQEKR